MLIPNAPLGPRSSAGSPKNPIINKQHLCCLFCTRDCIQYVGDNLCFVKLIQRTSDKQELIDNMKIQHVINNLITNTMC